VVSFTARLLYFRAKSPWYSLDRKLGGPQTRYEIGGEEKSSQPLLEFEPQPIAQRCTTKDCFKIKEGKMSEIHSTHWENQKYIQHFGQKA
jgi:hypothetical protein